MADKIYTSIGNTQAVIISGYLGSGKTTLIKELLSSDSLKGKKLAVLENEFGSVGMDGKILERDGIELREVAGGCVCCTQQGRLVQELTVLAEMGMDIVFIEASGVADPNSIAAELFEPALFGKVSRGAGISVIDALNADAYISEDTAALQISFADILYISKGKQSKYLNQQISGLSPDAIIFQEDQEGEIAEQLLSPLKERPQIRDESSSGANHGFDSFHYQRSIPFITDSFRYAINQILKKGDCYRIKGLVKVCDSPSFYFESVRYYGEEKPLDYVGLDMDTQLNESSLVLIGRKIDKNFIRETLDEALLSYNY
jgi:G3E family GTPase